MGYLGAQQRRLGHLGVGTSFDRYAYVWNNPLGFYDLDGRDVCIPSPWGDACAGEAAEDVGNAAGNVANGAGSGVESAWNWTQPGRQWVGERAQDFVKLVKKNVPYAKELDDALNCLGEAIAHPTEDLECLPDTPDEPFEVEDPPDPPDSFPPPPPLPPTPLPGPQRG